MRPGQRTLVVLSASSLLCQWSTRTTRHLKRAIARNWPHGGQKLSKNCPKVGRECGAYSTQPRSRGYPGTLLYLAVAFLQMKGSKWASGRPAIPAGPNRHPLQKSQNSSALSPPLGADHRCMAHVPSYRLPRSTSFPGPSHPLHSRPELGDLHGAVSTITRGIPR